MNAFIKADQLLKEYREADHPRDDQGRWTEAGGGGGGTASAPMAKPSRVSAGASWLESTASRIGSATTTDIGGWSPLTYQTLGGGLLGFATGHNVKLLGRVLSGAAPQGSQRRVGEQLKAKAKSSSALGTLASVAKGVTGITLQLAIALGIQASVGIGATAIRAAITGYRAGRTMLGLARGAALRHGLEAGRDVGQLRAWGMARKVPGLRRLVGSQPPRATIERINQKLGGYEAAVAGAEHQGKISGAIHQSKVLADARQQRVEARARRVAEDFRRRRQFRVIVNPNMRKLAPEDQLTEQEAAAVLEILPDLLSEKEVQAVLRALGPSSAMEKADELLKEWDESKHPRDDQGQWTESGSGSHASSGRQRAVVALSANSGLSPDVISHRLASVAPPSTARSVATALTNYARYGVGSARRALVDVASELPSRFGWSALQVALGAAYGGLFVGTFARYLPEILPIGPAVAGGLAAETVSQLRGSSPGGFQFPELPRLAKNVSAANATRRAATSLRAGALPSNLTEQQAEMVLRVLPYLLTPEEAQAVLTVLQTKSPVVAKADRLLKEFEESKHPRDEDGKWTSGSGGGGGSSASSGGSQSKSPEKSPDTAPTEKPKTVKGELLRAGLYALGYKGAKVLADTLPQLVLRGVAPGPVMAAMAVVTLAKFALGAGVLDHLWEAYNAATSKKVVIEGFKDRNKGEVAKAGGSDKDLAEKIAALSGEQRSAFFKAFIDSLDEEQAANFLDALKSKFSQTKSVPGWMDDSSVDKKLGAGATVKDYIDDFVNSSDPRFAGKSKKERIRMALGAFYSRGKAAPLTKRRRALTRADRLLKEWDENKHPRQPAGSAAGGEFAPVGGGGGGGSTGGTKPLPYSRQIRDTEDEIKELEREKAAHLRGGARHNDPDVVQVEENLRSRRAHVNRLLEQQKEQIRRDEARARATAGGAAYGSTGGESAEAAAYANQRRQEELAATRQTSQTTGVGMGELLGQAANVLLGTKPRTPEGEREAQQARAREAYRLQSTSQQQYRTQSALSRESTTTEEQKHLVNELNRFRAASQAADFRSELEERTARIGISPSPSRSTTRSTIASVVNLVNRSIRAAYSLAGAGRNVHGALTSYSRSDYESVGRHIDQLRANIKQLRIEISHLPKEATVVRRELTHTLSTLRSALSNARSRVSSKSAA